MIGSRIGHFEVTAKLGAGGMGEVYEALDTELGRTVAIKLLPDDLAHEADRLQRFRREARAIASLNHPNIVTIHSIEDMAGRPALVMEKVDGVTLQEKLPPGGLAVAEFLEIAIPVADALAATHDRGIVHRDLKPGNIMITPEGRVKILDFGLARLSEAEGAGGEGTEDETKTALLTMEGTVVGTAPYMSPEQLRGQKVDARSDVFSLGTVLYEMSTGRRPFQGKTSLNLASSILSETPPSVVEVRAELPEELGRIVAGCLEKDPDRRFQTARDLRDELENVRTGAGTTATRPMRGGADPRAGGPEAGVDSHSRAGQSPDAKNRASLLVAPFRALGSNELSGSLAEAITQSIANALTRFEEHSIIDPGSVPAGADARAGRDLARSLGATWVLDGQIQAAAGQVRITAQIVDATSGQRRWSDTFDRKSDDLFALQDELAAVVASTVGEALHAMTSENLARKPESAWTAFDHVNRGVEHLHRIDPEETAVARTHFEKALELDPELALAVVCNCWTYYFEVAMGWPRSREDNLDYCIRTLRALFVRNDRTAHGHRLLARCLHAAGQHTEGLRHAERAYELNPYDTDMLMNLSLSLSTTGEKDRSVELAERAVRVNPFAPPTFPAHLARAYFVAERYDDAVRTVDGMARPVANGDLYRVASLHMLDRHDEARESMKAILAERPLLSLELLRKSVDFTEGPHRERYLSSLVGAGLPAGERPPESR